MTGRRTYNITQGITSIFMMLALLWLTVSAPFVFAGRQKIAAERQLGLSTARLVNTGEHVKHAGHNAGNTHQDAGDAAQGTRPADGQPYSTQDNSLADDEARSEQDAGYDDDRSTQDDNKNSSCNPFGNNTEEKAPSTINLSEEYLHHSDDHFHAVELFLSHHPAPSADEYISFHGEMLCPPPNAVA